MSTTATSKPDPRLPLVSFQFEGEPTKNEPKHCQLCWAKFSLIKPRHYCDNCFNCICSNCSHGRGRRETPGSWLSEVVVKLCDYCMPNLMIQALTRAQLKKLPKRYLEDYVTAYNLTMSNDKTELIDAIVAAHPMPLQNELHYRKFKPCHSNTGQSWKKERQNRPTESQDSRRSEESVVAAAPTPPPSLSIEVSAPDPSPAADNLSQSLPSSVSIRSDTSLLSNETNRISNAFDSLPQELADSMPSIENNVSTSPPMPTLNRTPSSSSSLHQPQSAMSLHSASESISSSHSPRVSTPSPSSSPLSPYLQSQNLPEYYQMAMPGSPIGVPVQQYPPTGYASQNPSFESSYDARRSLMMRNLPAIPSSQPSYSPVISPSSMPLPSRSPPSPSPALQTANPQNMRAPSPSPALQTAPPQTMRAPSPILPPRPPQIMSPPISSPVVPPRPPSWVYLANSDMNPSNTPLPAAIQPSPRRGFDTTPTIATLAKNRTSLASLSEQTLEDIIALQGVEIPPGLLEKDDLVREVQAMVDAYRRNQVRDQDEDKDICKVCLDNEIQTVLVECGHMAVCVECGDKLMATRRPECPICRAAIVKVLRTFRT